VSASPGPEVAESAAPSQSPHVNADPAVDWEQIMKVSDGDLTFAQELVQLFIDSGDETLRDISAAMHRGDLAAIRSGAHSFKGSSANIYAPSASAAAGRLEDAARSGHVDQISRLEAELRGEAAKVMEFLRARQA
jgi:two-component system sensor histidine kinase/response regulator